MKISDLIGGPPVACRPDVPLTEVAAKMVAESVGSVVVVDGTRLVGIVTDRDIVEATADPDFSQRNADSAMTVGPDTIDVETEVGDAVDWLNATGYRHLPVTEDGDLVGIVSIKDLLWAVAGR